MLARADSKIETNRLAYYYDAFFWSLVLAAGAYKLWLVAALPFFIPMNLPHDITWFVFKAMSISREEWFGDTYNHYTLIKGPAYPLFLSWVSSVGISPKLAVDILYVIAAIVFSLALKRVFNSRFAALVGLVLVLLNPVTFSEYWTSLVRMTLYLPMVLIFISAILVLTHTGCKPQQRLSLGWALLAALSLAVAWHTREESIWMLSLIGPLMLVFLWRLFKPQLRINALLVIVVLIAVPWLVAHQFASINEEKYGFYGKADTQAPQFSRAIDAIYSLNTKDHSFYYLTSETRDKMLSISPNTRQLVTSLLDPQLKDYENLGASVGGSYASWAIRGAMADNGFYQDFKSTELAYQQIADDIERYCEQASGNCRPTLLSGVLIKPERYRWLRMVAEKGLWRVVGFQPFPAADKWAERQRGDTGFQYTVGRFFGVYPGFGVAMEKAAGVDEIERHQLGKAQMWYRNYQYDFFLILLLAACIAVPFWVARSLSHILVGTMLLGGFAASFAIYVLVSTFAVPDFVRVLSTTTVPMLCFAAYYLAAAVAWLQHGAAGLLGLVLKKPLSS